MMAVAQESLWLWLRVARSRLGCVAEKGQRCTLNTSLDEIEYDGEATAEDGNGWLRADPKDERHPVVCNVSSAREVSLSAWLAYM